MTTLEDARILAGELKKRSPLVRGVDLIGSVAKHGTGHDVDLAILVDDDVARQWWAAEERNIRPKWPHFLLPVRRFCKIVFRPFDHFLIAGREARKRARASRLLGVDLDKLVSLRPNVPYIDSFLFPKDWRDGIKPDLALMESIAQVQGDWRAKAFFEYAARDAIRIA